MRIRSGLFNVYKLKRDLTVVSIILCMYGPPRECKRKMKVASWSAQMYTAFVGVLDSWPGWNALRSAPI